MRIAKPVLAALAAFWAFPAAAQEWAEYVNMEDHFAVNFPGDPAIEETTYMLASGTAAPARIYTVKDGGSTYRVTVVDYTNAGDTDTAGAIAYAADTFRQSGGEITYDNDGSYEGIDTWMMQINNADETRSFIAISQPPESAGLHRLYIVEGRAPVNGIVPGQFQQSLAFRDAYGERIRYGRDVEGNRFRVIPETGGQPYTRRR